MTEFKKGDCIKYASQGVCRIEDIKMLDYTHSHNEQLFYVLKPIGAAASTVYVPVSNTALTSKMRRLLKKEEIDELIRSSKDVGMEWIDDRKARSESFKAVVKRCEVQELLRLVSCIYLKKKELADSGKKLSSTDETILAQAEGFIENEFSFVLNLNGVRVGEYIRSILDSK